MISGALVLQILTALGGLAGFSAVVNLLISKKKINAESNDIAQSTNDKLIKNLTDDNKTLRADIAQTRAEIAEIRKQNTQLYDIIERMEAEEMDLRRILNRLVMWSRTAYEQSIESGVQLEQPPSREYLDKIMGKS